VIGSLLAPLLDFLAPVQGAQGCTKCHVHGLCCHATTRWNAAAMPPALRAD